MCSIHDIFKLWCPGIFTYTTKTIKSLATWIFLCSNDVWCESRLNIFKQHVMLVDVLFIFFDEYLKVGLWIEIFFKELNNSLVTLQDLIVFINEVGRICCEWGELCMPHWCRLPMWRVSEWADCSANLTSSFAVKTCFSVLF